MKVTEREKRFLLLLVFSAVFFAFLNWAVLPWSEKFMTSADELTLAEKKLRQKKELLASRPQVEAQVKDLQARLDAEEKKLLPSTDPNQAAAQLQQWLAQRAGEQKVEILRSDFLPVAAVSDNYVRVPVRLDVTGPITQMVQFMNTLTHADRIVAVDELNVNSGFVDKEKKVRCTVVVSALMPKTS